MTWNYVLTLNQGHLLSFEKCHQQKKLYIHFFCNSKHWWHWDLTKDQVQSNVKSQSHAIIAFHNHHGLEVNMIEKWKSAMCLFIVKLLLVQERERETSLFSKQNVVILGGYLSLYSCYLGQMGTTFRKNEIGSLRIFRFEFLIIVFVHCNMNWSWIWIFYSAYH